MSKKVSIIIPVYNGSNYLKDSIESALAQTYKNIEVIVVNDGSNDGGATKKIAESYLDKIKYYEKENGGASTALNLAISKMTGDYMSWLSHDDLYYPEKVEKQMEEIKKYDEKTILFSNFDLIDENGVKYDTICYDHNHLMRRPDDAVLRGCIGGITLLIPKKALEECGEFRTDLRCVQDYEMWFRMLLKGYHFTHMDQVLTMTRVHPGQDSQTSPKMITEGNWLWTYITENYPKERIIETETSEYVFYKEMENYLKTTPYKEAVEKVNSLANQELKKSMKKGKQKGVTVIVIDKGDKHLLEETIKCIKQQTLHPESIMIEGKEKSSSYDTYPSRKEILKKIKTTYYVFLHSGIIVDKTWLSSLMTLAEVTKKSVIVTDYPRPLRGGASNNYCSLLVPIDGVLLKKEKEVKEENDMQLILDTALIGGSFTTEEKYLQNKEYSYQMSDVYKYQRRVLEEGKSTNYQLACLNYDISCIYNSYSKEGTKVSMYEPCDEYKQLKFSRSFQIYKKYYDYKMNKKKRL